MAQSLQSHLKSQLEADYEMIEHLEREAKQKQIALSVLQQLRKKNGLWRQTIIEVAQWKYDQEEKTNDFQKINSQTFTTLAFHCGKQNLSSLYKHGIHPILLDFLQDYPVPKDAKSMITKFLYKEAEHLGKAYADDISQADALETLGAGQSPGRPGRDSTEGAPSIGGTQDQPAPPFKNYVDRGCQTGTDLFCENLPHKRPKTGHTSAQIQGCATSATSPMQPTTSTSPETLTHPATRSVLQPLPRPSEHVATSTTPYLSTVLEPAAKANPPSGPPYYMPPPSLHNVEAPTHQLVPLAARAIPRTQDRNTFLLTMEAAVIILFYLVRSRSGQISGLTITFPPPEVQLPYVTIPFGLGSQLLGVYRMRMTAPLGTTFGMS